MLYQGTDTNNIYFHFGELTFQKPSNDSTKRSLAQSMLNIWHIVFNAMYTFIHYRPCSMRKVMFLIMCNSVLRAHGALGHAGSSPHSFWWEGGSSSPPSGRKVHVERRPFWWKEVPCTQRDEEQGWGPCLVRLPLQDFLVKEQITELYQCEKNTSLMSVLVYFNMF